MKRNHDDDTNSGVDVEELLGQILNCSENEAIFFLESSLWNLEKAIHFWLESNKNSISSSSSVHPNRRFKNSESFAAGSDLHFDQIFIKDLPPKYEHRNLNLSDLPENWSAWIHPHTGSIYFLHIPSGFIQYSVPQGYADVMTSYNSEVKEPEILESERLLSVKSLSHHVTFTNEHDNC